MSAPPPVCPGDRWTRTVDRYTVERTVERVEFGNVFYLEEKVFPGTPVRRRRSVVLNGFRAWCRLATPIAPKILSLPTQGV